MTDLEITKLCAEEKYCYMFWYHDEYGPEELKATLDRNLVVELLKTYDKDGMFSRAKENPVDKVNSLLLLKNEELMTYGGIHPLGHGWGGLHFQIVVLYAGN